MGNEIYYCTQCGIRVSGSEFEPGTSGFGADRSSCAACLGLPTPSRRESSKRIRRPSSATVVAVAARPKVVEAPPRKIAFPALFGAVCLTAAAVAAVFACRDPQPELPRETKPAAPVVVSSVPPPSPVLPSPAPEAAKEKEPLPAAPEPVAPDLEARAEAASDSIQEAASALADEGRFSDALARIRAFPAEFRRSRAWNNLEALRRQIEQRAR